ncbi:MAG: AEC family transporter, partial [Cyanothece sp. SIO2G6]|nr:AEC family transporter [Cyanothece sp. SIO2G6]
MAVLLSAVLPIALVALVGIAVGRWLTVDVQTLARLSIYAFLPALVLRSLAETTLALQNAIAITIVFLLNTTLLYLIAIGCSHLLQFSPDQKKSLIATTIFANVGNMGLPFVLFSLGNAGLERAVVYLVASSLMIASVFPVVLVGKGIASGIGFTLRLPVLWAALAGMGLQWWGSLPVALERGIVLLADGAIPLALLMLGIQLSRTPFIFGPYELFGTGLRLIVSPALAYGIATILGITGLDLQVVVLQSAMPVAVNSLIWVIELGGDRTRVARTIV